MIILKNFDYQINAIVYIYSTRHIEFGTCKYPNGQTVSTCLYLSISECNYVFERETKIYIFISFTLNLSLLYLGLVNTQMAKPFLYAYICQFPSATMCMREKLKNIYLSLLH